MALPKSVETREVAPREAETPQVQEVDRDRMKTEAIRDESLEARDKRRVDAATPVPSPAEFAAKRRKAEEDARPKDEVPAQEEGDVKGLTSKSSESQGLTWTGRNIDQMVEFCGPDTLGQPAATFSHEWTGNAKLHVFDASVGESDEASGGTTHEVEPGQVVVRSGKRSDGGWNRLFVLTEDGVSRRFDSGGSADKNASPVVDRQAA